MYIAGMGAIALPSAFYIGSFWGTIGIATAWTIAHPLAVYFPLNTRLLRRLDLPVRNYLRALWPAVSGCLLMTAAVAAVRTLVPVAPATGIRLTLEVLAGAIAYSACLLLFHRNRVTAFIALWRHPTL
jgi:PST family polysaccharide transporter